MVTHVYLIPGLSVPYWIMWPLARRLQRKGYITKVIHYHSRRQSMSDSADYIWRQIHSEKPGQTAIIAHSMGGLVAQIMLDRYQPTWVKQLILVATPNHGVEMFDHLKRSWLTKWFLFVIGALPRHNFSMRKEPIAPNVCMRYPTYLLTGISYKTLNQFFIPGPNDGIVSVKSATIPGLKAIETLNYAHGILIFRKKTARVLGDFLSSA